MNRADKRGLILPSKEEWELLEWKNTNLSLQDCKNGKILYIIEHVAEYLGYKKYAKITNDRKGKMGEYCYEKNDKLYIFRGCRPVKYAELPQTKEMVFDLD